MAFRRMVRYVGISAVFAAILAAHSATQAIEDLVTDTSGAVVAGAKVTITNLGTGVTNSVATNASGNYIFNLVPVEVSTSAALLPIENANAGGIIENERIIELFSVSANGIRANVAGTSGHDWLQGRHGLPNSPGKDGTFRLAGNRNSLHGFDRGEASIDRERVEVVVVIQSEL